MTLTRLDIEQYVNMALNVKQLPKKDVYLSYDTRADVVYINFHNPAKPAYDTELTDDNVIIRYDNQEEIVGLTILHASSRRSIKLSKREGRDVPPTAGVDSVFRRTTIISKKIPTKHEILRCAKQYT